AGHLVTAVSAVESSNAGWHAIEHLGASYGIVLDCAADEANIRSDIVKLPPVPPAPGGPLSPFVVRGLQAPLYQRVIDTYDETKCQGVAQVLANHRTWQPLTLIRLRTMLTSDDQRWRSDPNLKYVEPTSRALWEQLAHLYTTNVSASEAAMFRSYYDLQRNM